MIDMTLMNGTSLDESSGLVRIQGGVLNSGVYTALREHNVTITHGRCPAVGAAGFLLGGGIGFNMRENGLACDQVTASEIVTADGKLRSMSATREEDLFWACRGGGGGNFGVNTSFTMQTFPVAPQVTVFQISWSAKPEAVARALMTALEAGPTTLGSRVSLSAVTPEQQALGQDVVVNLLGQFKGSQKDLMAILADVYAVAQPSTTNIYEMTYWQGQDFLHEDQPPCYYQERSAFANVEIGGDALAMGFKHLRQWPGTHSYCDLRFFQTGDAMNKIGARDTAFVHRSSQWLMVVGLYWNDQDDRDRARVARNHEWQNEFYHAMLPFCGGGAYQNFADPSLKNWQESYYGENYERLARIKQRVDPAGVFTFAQAV
jgi:FAD/FMN-containing dehydrogenase